MRNVKWFFVSTLSLVVIGCSSDKPGVSDPVAVVADQKSAADNEKIAREAKEKKDHADRIEGFKSQWAAIPEASKGDFGWMDEAKGFSKEGLDACNRGKQFKQFNELYSLAKAHPDDAKGAGLPPIAEVRAKYVKIAGDYFSAFAIVAIKGTIVACKAGEGYSSRDLPFDTSDLETFLSDMNDSEIGPEDIGTTPAKIRAVHFALFKRDMPDLKKRIDTDSGDAIGAVGSRMESWHYKATELGLTPAQIAKIDPPTSKER